MSSVRARGRFGLGVAAVGMMAAVAAACTPPPESPGTTTSTSTTTTLPELPAQCVDSVNNGEHPGADHYYTGVPDVAGNMQMHESYDGTCSGPRPPHTFFDYTAVFAATYQEAEALCAAAGGTGTSGTWKSQGWVAMGDHAWVCNAQI